MKVRTAILCLLLVLGALAAVLADTKTPSANVARFEALKKLAGEWVAIGENGKPAGPVAASVKVTAAGTVVQETLFPGTDHEMVTMYHLDGQDLVLTHYCAAGNQPRMKAEAGGSPDRIEFKLAGVTNRKSTDELCMEHATLVIQNKDRYQAEWVAYKEGKECHKANLNFQRKK